MAIEEHLPEIFEKSAAEWGITLVESQSEYQQSLYTITEVTEHTIFNLDHQTRPDLVISLESDFQ